MKINISDYLVCPHDHGELDCINGIAYRCKECGSKFPFEISGVPNFLSDDINSARLQHIPLNAAGDGSSNWSPGLRYWNPGFLAKLLKFGYGVERPKELVPEGALMLDVGCGGNAQGDINTDVYIPSPLPKNFLLASAEKLPFKSGSIDIVRSAYVIEHNPHPALMLKEHSRVSKHKVIAYTDNSDWLGAILLRALNTGYIFHDEHYYKWSKEYMENLIARLKLRGVVKLFNGSPSLFVKIFSLFGIIPRIGPLFYRDLKVELTK